MQKSVDMLTVKDSQKFEVHAGPAMKVSYAWAASLSESKSASVYEGMGTKKFGIAPSSYKFWSSIPIGMKRCKLPASSRARWTQIVVPPLGTTWTM
jgi:hypothetical protein